MSVHHHPTARRKADQSQNGGVADGGGPPYDGGMETRVAKLEADLTAIKVDLAVIKASGATKSDLAEAKSSIILWVVGAIFVAQLLPMLRDFVKPAAVASPAPVATPSAPQTK